MDIEKLAREAGVEPESKTERDLFWAGDYYFNPEELNRFAELVREHERARCYDIAMREPFLQPAITQDDVDEFGGIEAASEAALKAMAFDITTKIRAAASLATEGGV